MKVEFKKKISNALMKSKLNTERKYFLLQTMEYIQNKFKIRKPSLSYMKVLYDEEIQSEYLSMYWKVKVSDEKENIDKIISVWIN